MKNWIQRGALAGVVLIGIGGLSLTFDPVGLGWDSAEYIWAVRANYLPHSPYLGYLLMAKLASLAAPAPVALSLLSSLSCLGSACLLSLILRNLEPRGDAGIIAAFLYLILPITLAQGGMQEVYAPQAFFILLALWFLSGELRTRTSLSGLVFAFALLIHSGTILTLPAIVVLIFRGTWRQPRESIRSALAFVLPNLAVGVLCLVTVVIVFRTEADPLQAALAYLRGIAPTPPSPDPARFPISIAQRLRAFFSEPIVGMPLFFSILAGYGLVAAAARHSLFFFLWATFPALFLLYESLLGRSPDPGAYAVYYAPPLAAFSSYGILRMVERLSTWRTERVSPRRLRFVSRSLALILLTVPLVHNYRALAHSFPRRRIEEFDSHPYVRASRWINRTLPPEVIVVQPFDVPNVNLLPSLHLRRPVIFQHGKLYLQKPSRPWLPMNLNSYEVLTKARLLSLIREEHARLIVFETALARKLPPGLELVTLDSARRAGISLYEIRPTRPVLGGQSRKSREAFETNTEMARETTASIRESE